MQRILTITLNPAIDISTTVPEIAGDAKLRCDEPRYESGGGGINVSRVINALGGASTALVAIGGVTGDALRDLIAEARVDAEYLIANGMTRQSFSVQERNSGNQYRFVFPGPVQDSRFSEKVLEKTAALLSTGQFPYVVASGSLPPGLADGFYAEIASIAKNFESRFILDTSGPALRSALCSDIFLVKPDRFEAAALATDLNIDSGEPFTLAREIAVRYAVEAVIVTLGADGAVLFTNGSQKRYYPPPVTSVSKVGAGDIFIGALAFALTYCHLL